MRALVQENSCAERSLHGSNRSIAKRNIRKTEEAFIHSNFNPSSAIDGGGSVSD
jgi:hypothetical protein